MFTVKIVASCGVEKETHTPFNTKLWSSEFLGCSFPLLFLYDSRCKWTPIPPCNRKNGLWFYLKGRGVELNALRSCFWNVFVCVCPLLLLCDRPLDRCCRRSRSRFVALRSWLLVLWKASLRTAIMILFQKHPLSFVGILKSSINKTIISIWSS